MKLTVKHKHLAIVLAVPLMACSVFARQVYLQIFCDLSVWKGGGMGMFAGIGAPSHRFLKVFLVDQLGKTIVAARFDTDLARLITAARTEPTQENFRRLANALLATRWVLRRETITGLRVDSQGRQVGLLPTRHLSVEPALARTTARQRILPGSPGWLPKQVRIEFWKLHYDRDGKRLFASRAATFEAENDESG